jgi:cytochrome c556
MKLKLVAAAMTAVVGSGYLLTAWTQVRPEVLVKQRQGKMALQAKYFGPLAGMAQGKVPYSADAAARNVGFLEPLSKMAWDAFDPSTANLKTRALPAVFEEPAKFKAAADRLESEVSKLAAAVKAGDEGAVKSQIGAVGKACQGCHDQFQAKQ